LAWAQVQPAQTADTAASTAAPGMAAAGNAAPGIGAE